MLKLRVCVRADTPAYTNFDVEVPDNATKDQIRAVVDQQFREKDEAGELEYDVAFEFSGRKIISANAGGLGKTIVEFEPLEFIPHDMGIEAQLYLTGQISHEEFLAKARANGIEPAENLQGPSPV